MVIWEIGKNDEINLDCYEGFPTLYYKKDLAVPVNGKLIKSMVYIMYEHNLLGVSDYPYYKTIESSYAKFYIDPIY